MKIVVNDKKGKHIFDADRKCYWLTDEHGTVLTDEQINSIKKAKTIAKKYAIEKQVTVYINSYSKKIKLIESTIIPNYDGTVCMLGSSNLSHPKEL